MRVVDLATDSRIPRAVSTGPRHESVLAYLRFRGEADKAELLAQFPELATAELLALLEDLAVLGRVRLRWSTPFRFRVTCGDDRGDPARAPVLAVA